MLRIYTDLTHYQVEYRNQLVPILRPYTKAEPITASARESMYGTFVRNLELVPSPLDADICVLPMKWRHYLHTNTQERADSFVQLARSYQKPTVVWNGGDHTHKVPWSDVFVFAANGYQSRRLPQQFAYPTFIHDPVMEMKCTSISLRPYQAKPTVGFCGQAKHSNWQLLFKSLMILARNLKYHIGVSSLEPHSPYPPTLLRARALDLLEDSSNLNARFVKRQHYRGGQGKPAKTLRQEFLDNIVDTDYTLCVRGTANYSQRFYETLALGRIPIFVNTDCILPYDEQINWREYCIWVEQRDLPQLPQIVVEFHQALDQEKFQSLQSRCRRLWETRLSYAGFHDHFAEHFCL